MEVAILDVKGEDTGRKAMLSDEVFGIKPNDHAIYLDVKQYLANQRQGTHQSKERGDISGSTRKIKKQKGTGTARSGSIKSPIFKGGGRVFGPRSRSYSFKLNKNLKQLARKSALSIQLEKDNVLIVEDFTFETIKTKHFTNVLKDLGLDSVKSLFILKDHDRTVYLSSRNLKTSTVINHSLLNTYTVLNAGKLVITESSLEEINNNYK